MSKNRVVASQRLSVMHQPVASAHAPQRRGPHPVLRSGAAILHDAVSRPHVVEQEVSEWVNVLVTQGRWHGECSAIDHSSHRSCSDRGHVTDGAADGVKYVLACY